MYIPDPGYSIPDESGSRGIKSTTGTRYLDPYPNQQHCISPIQYSEIWTPGTRSMNFFFDDNVNATVDNMWYALQNKNLSFGVKDLGSLFYEILTAFFNIY